MVPAVEEQRRVIARHGPGITLEALNEMEVLHRNVQEAGAPLPAAHPAAAPGPQGLHRHHLHGRHLPRAQGQSTPPDPALPTWASTLQHCAELTLLTSSLLAMGCVCLAANGHTALGNRPSHTCRATSLRPPRPLRTACRPCLPSRMTTSLNGAASHSFCTLCEHDVPELLNTRRPTMLQN